MELQTVSTKSWHYRLVVATGELKDGEACTIYTYWFNKVPTALTIGLFMSFLYWFFGWYWVEGNVQYKVRANGTRVHLAPFQWFAAIGLFVTVWIVMNGLTKATGLAGLLSMIFVMTEIVLASVCIALFVKTIYEKYRYMSQSSETIKLR